MTAAPSRPILRYHGGKWRLAPWIISLFPAHRTYTEVYGGAASVLLRKPRSYAEVYNDLDSDVVNLFRILRDPGSAEELGRLVALTPYSRQEFDDSYEPCTVPLEQARRLLFRSAAGFGTGGGSRGTGFRSNVTRSYSTPADNWTDMPAVVEMVSARFRGVIIEHRPAIEVLQRYDGPDALHYVDPPYLNETRNVQTAGNVYRHEMSDQDHIDLATVARSLAGAVVVSGYPSALYDFLYAGWECLRMSSHADGARDRTECVWLNRPTAPGLFDEVEYP